MPPLMCQDVWPAIMSVVGIDNVLQVKSKAPVEHMVFLLGVRVVGALEVLSMCVKCKVCVVSLHCPP